MRERLQTSEGREIYGNGNASSNRIMDTTKRILDGDNIIYGG